MFTIEDIEVALLQKAVSDDIQVPLLDLPAIFGRNEEIGSIPNQSIVGIAVCKCGVLLTMH